MVESLAPPETEPSHTLIPYDEVYKERVTVFIQDILSNEIGHTNIPRPDIYDIRGAYLEKDGGFWLMIDQKTDAVIGTVEWKIPNICCSGHPHSTDCK